MEMDWKVVSVVITVFDKILFDVYERWQKRIDARRRIVLKYGDEVAIRACDSTFVQPNSENILIGGISNVAKWEIYEIVDPADPFSYSHNRKVCYGDSVAFRSIKNRKFIGVDLENSNLLKAWAPQVEDWEIFVLIAPPDSVKKGKFVEYGKGFALKAVNSKYVMYNCSEDLSLMATVSHIRKWEVFVFIDPPHPK